MYRIGMQLSFRARHFLTGGDWGPENQLHHHDYRVEWILGGPELDRHGYLLDLTAVESILDGVVSAVRDKTLNELPAFAGLNPSVERLTRFLSDGLIAGRSRWDPEGRLTSSVVQVHENASAWASWSTDLAKSGGSL